MMSIYWIVSRMMYHEFPSTFPIICAILNRLCIACKFLLLSTTFSRCKAIGPLPAINLGVMNFSEIRGMVRITSIHMVVKLIKSNLYILDIRVRLGLE